MVVHGVLFITQLITARKIGIQIPIDIRMVLCFIKHQTPFHIEVMEEHKELPH